MNITAVTVFKSTYPKIRLGKDNDGGYIISTEFDNYDCMLACGVSDDISFEEDFLTKYPNTICYAFDGTVGGTFPTTDKNIIFVNKNIGISNNEKETNLHEYFDKYENIFVKMDIEGYEFPWLSTLNENQLKKLKQLVVEYHYPASYEQNWKMLEKLLNTHVLVHIHSHNGCGFNRIKYQNNKNEKNIIIPNLIECTYILKDSNKKYEISDELIPSKIDQRNCPENDFDIPLIGFPYNNFTIIDGVIIDKDVCENCCSDALMKCSKCNKSKYCSRDCQMKKWKEHKIYCL